MSKEIVPIQVKLLRSITSADIKLNSDFHKLEPNGSVVSEIVEDMSKTTFGQDRALHEVARSLVRAYSGLSLPDRPLFSGLFLGMPGVGKTSTAQAIAKHYYPQTPEEHVKILDSATYNERHTIGRLTGAPPGYVGYGDKPVITSEFLSKPNVIVVDEVEKGCREWHELWLGVLDRGRLPGSVGKRTYVEVENRDLDFSNSLIIFTSNIGSSELRAAKKGAGQIGFKTEAKPQDMTKVGIDAFKKYFKQMPEFPNRLDAVVVFDDLTPEVYNKLVYKFLGEYNDNQRMSQNYIAVTGEARQFLVDKTDKEFGGRELRRTIEKEIITPAAELKFAVPDGVPLVADVEDGKVVFYTSTILERQAEFRRLEEAEELKKKWTTPQSNPRDEEKTKDEDAPSSVSYLFAGDTQHQIKQRLKVWIK